MDNNGRFMTGVGSREALTKIGGRKWIHNIKEASIKKMTPFQTQ